MQSVATFIEFLRASLSSKKPRVAYCSPKFARENLARINGTYFPDFLVRMKLFWSLTRFFRNPVFASWAADRFSNKNKTINVRKYRDNAIAMLAEIKMGSTDDFDSEQPFHLEIVTSDGARCINHENEGFVSEKCARERLCFSILVNVGCHLFNLYRSEPREEALKSFLANLKWTDNLALRSNLFSQIHLLLLLLTVRGNFDTGAERKLIEGALPNVGLEDIRSVTHLESHALSGLRGLTNPNSPFGFVRMCREEQALDRHFTPDFEEQISRKRFYPLCRSRWANNKEAFSVPSDNIVVNHVDKTVDAPIPADSFFLGRPFAIEIRFNNSLMKFSHHLYFTHEIIFDCPFAIAMKERVVSIESFAFLSVTFLREVLLHEKSVRNLMTHNKHLLYTNVLASLHGKKEARLGVTRYHMYHENELDETDVDYYYFEAHKAFRPLTRLSKHYASQFEAKKELADRYFSAQLGIWLLFCFMNAFITFDPSSSSGRVAQILIRAVSQFLDVASNPSPKVADFDLFQPSSLRSGHIASYVCFDVNFCLLMGAWLKRDLASVPLLGTMLDSPWMHRFQFQRQHVDKARQMRIDFNYRALGTLHHVQLRSLFDGLIRDFLMEQHPLVPDYRLVLVAPTMGRVVVDRADLNDESRRLELVKSISRKVSDQQVAVALKAYHPISMDIVNNGVQELGRGPGVTDSVLVEYAKAVEELRIFAPRSQSERAGEQHSKLWEPFGRLLRYALSNTDRVMVFQHLPVYFFRFLCEPPSSIRFSLADYFDFDVEAASQFAKMLLDSQLDATLEAVGLDFSDVGPSLFFSVPGTSAPVTANNVMHYLELLLYKRLVLDAYDVDALYSLYLGYQNTKIEHEPSADQLASFFLTANVLTPAAVLRGISFGGCGHHAKCQAGKCDISGGSDTCPVSRLKTFISGSDASTLAAFLRFVTSSPNIKEHVTAYISVSLFDSPEKRLPTASTCNCQLNLYSYPAFAFETVEDFAVTMRFCLEQIDFGFV